MASWSIIEKKMVENGVARSAVLAFRAAWESLQAGQDVMLPESAIQPVEGLPNYNELADTVTSEIQPLVDQTVILKLNGGLGTGMGLERAKSLLPLRDGLTFLDLILRQIDYLRKAGCGDPAFVLMNSFSTSEDTMVHLKTKNADGVAELMQNRVPKIAVDSLLPVEWPEQPSMEWCPPGHGDLYAAIRDSGMLEYLLREGRRYLFVSNADNLGAILDTRLLGWFAESGLPFVMEVTPRTGADRKGGHLARSSSDGRLLLRESAQCPECDAEAFQDIERHRFFNTNNLWIRLDALKTALDACDGALPLPVIRNQKTVDPRDGKSQKVWQLETAMGAAISCFREAGAIVVPRTRFAPVKTTADLLAVRSDAFQVSPDGSLALAASRNGVPPLVTLDSKHYKMVDQLDTCLANGVPSLLECKSLNVEGPVVFAAQAVFAGEVTISNTGPSTATVPGGRHQDKVLKLD